MRRGDRSLILVTRLPAAALEAAKCFLELQLLLLETRHQCQVRRGPADFIGDPRLYTGMLHAEGRRVSILHQDISFHEVGRRINHAWMPLSLSKMYQRTEF
jgi:hypothetical protein